MMDCSKKTLVYLIVVKNYIKKKNEISLFLMNELSSRVHKVEIIN